MAQDSQIKRDRENRRRNKRIAARSHRREIKAYRELRKAEASRKAYWRERYHDAQDVRKRHLARARFWLVKLRKRRDYLEAQKNTEFKSWMLNGRPSNIEPQVQKAIAVGVLKFGLVVTSTSTGPHTPSSFHFPWNNPRHNGKGRGVDMAGGINNMSEYTKYGLNNHEDYDEFFGPPNTRFVKNGVVYNGSIPNHWNHNHIAPKYGAKL